MPLNHCIRSGDNEDITAERMKATFDTNKMAAEIYGESFRDRRREITAEILKRPELISKESHTFLSREQRITEAARKTVALKNAIGEIVNPAESKELAHIMAEVHGIDGHPLGLHGVMFIPALEGQASQEQKRRWLEPALRHEIIGAYAQTELGHGTNLKKLETTATYDRETQEFVLHSPNPTARKWWPGNLGKSANHAIVMAQLYIDGKCHGPHNFILQLRDRKTHEPLPNIYVGDIGSKMGSNTIDNGFLALDHVRIPRENMLCRYAKVSPDGTYTRPPHSKLGYGAMVHVRSHMVSTAGGFIAHAATIAIRYSCVRWQGEIEKGSSKEVQILDYQTQQHRLFPQLARAYAFTFCGEAVVSMYHSVLKDIENGQTETLADLHAITSGLKSVCSFQSGESVEQCRMACGGHGYSAASRLPELYGHAIGACTYEGENMVMLLQLARYLMRTAQKIRDGGKTGALTAYLAGPDMPFKGTANGNLLTAFEHIARKLTFRALDRLDMFKSKGDSDEIAWNRNGVEMQRASRAHCRLFIVTTFADRVHSISDTGCRAAMNDLLKLHLLYELIDQAHYLLEDGYISSSRLEAMKEEMYDTLVKLRPNAVSLVDSFDFSDSELRSMLGMRDGHAYKHLIQWAHTSELNKTDVLPGIRDHLLPMMERARTASKLMSLNHCIQSGDNEDITAERMKATFDTNKMAAEIHGAEFRDRRREITADVLKRPELVDKQSHTYLSREEKISEASRKTSALTEVLTDIVDPFKAKEIMHYVSVVQGIDGHPLMLQGAMFLPALQGQASKQQRKKWLGPALRLEMIGTYAQTELGHGTNLSKLETTATYDKKTQEFVLNTPTPTGRKWWPGNLGKCANHAIVVAQLYIDGKCYGPHNFFMQLRCIKTHEPLPGIHVGDIGSKMGANTIDNGFLALDHVRIPRENMLCRHAQVAADGAYSKPPHSKLGYGAMVYVRSHMIGTTSTLMAYAATIAIRYACVRRQGEMEKGDGKEVQILDYQTQQHRLFPQLARAYAFLFSGDEVLRMYHKVMRDIKSGQTETLADLHAITSGLKSVCSFQSGESVEQCRMACGGHGYSAASRLPELYAMTIAGCTYEGENMVMLLQLARYLMRTAVDVRNGKQAGALTAYLAAPGDQHSMIGRARDRKHTHLLSAFEHIARKITLRTADRLEEFKRKGDSDADAWNKNAVEMQRSSRAHTRFFIANAFAERVKNISDEGCRAVMDDLLRLHLLYELIDQAHYLLEDGYISSSQLEWMKNEMYDTLAKLRPNAVSLVDSFDWSDTELRSMLGIRDGHVYKHLIDWVQASELNRTDVLPGIRDHLLPMMERAREASKL